MLSLTSLARLTFQYEKYFKIAYCGSLSKFSIKNQTVSKNLESYRCKHSFKGGAKGNKNKGPDKFISAINDSDGNEDIQIEDSDYDSVANTAMNIVRKINFEQNVMIIQPYVKWGPNKSVTTPELKLAEAESLVRSLPSWNVGYSIKVPLESLEKKQLFGKGKLEELKTLFRQINNFGNRITCLFVSKGTLSFSQKKLLESEFHVPVMDRYSIVIQILRLHATSAEAKIQVAMAEIPYIWAQYKQGNLSTSRKQGFYLNDLHKEMLRKRESKLKQELEKIRSHRKLLRNKRKQEFPIVAVVGYTNSGKTSLIKALTNEQAIQPRNQLFATLDVTAHAGLLPCNLQVIYMDTVGFMSDIPTGLLECFIATLEDAMLADVIIHVQDLSHENCIQQKLHVENTLESLIAEMSQSLDVSFSPDKIINVGNKIDLVQSPTNIDESLNLVSSKTFVGLSDLLNEVEEKILKLTNRQKITMRIKNGGNEMAWLYKNSTVTNSRADPDSEERLLLDVVISHANFEIFKHNFIKMKS